MTVLYPVLPLGDDETPPSFVSRLAVLHRAGSARMFASDLGLRFQDIVDGSPTALENLSRLTNAPLDRLILNSLTRDGPSSYRFRGERLIKASVQRTAPRVCPACLADNLATTSTTPAISAQGRWDWAILHLRTCPRHEQPLIEAAVAPTPRRAHDFAAVLGARIIEIAAQARQIRHRPVSPLESYLRDRLNGIIGRFPWLDSLEFSAAALTCEVIGAVSANGRKVNLDALTDSDRNDAGAHGFAIASKGNISIRAWLADLQATYPYKRYATEGPQATLGKVYIWLAQYAPDRAFDPVRNLVGSHLLETTPLGPNDLLFGQPVEKRRLHSIYTAAQEHTVHPKRLRKILTTHGLIEADAQATDNRVLFDAEAAHAIIAEEKDSITLVMAETYLNAGRSQTKILADNGLIISTDGFQNDTNHYARFSKRGLDEFINQLTSQATPVATTPDGAYDIPTAANRANCSSVEVIRLILDCKLSWVGILETERGYMGVLVDLAEIKSAVHGPPIDGFTAHQLRRDLATNLRVISALTKNGIFRPVTVVSPVNRCPIQIVPSDQVAAYNATYVSLMTLAAERAVHFSKISASLRAAGILPALDKATYGAQIYRRSDIPENL